MLTWNEVQLEVQEIHALLAQDAPDGEQAKQKAADLAQKISDRKKEVAVNFDEEALKKAAKHIAFETQHFRCYSEIRKRFPNASRDHPAASQGIGYALLLHTRVLLDFFFNPPSSDDCCVAHFNRLDGFEAKFPQHIHAPTQHTLDVSRALNKFLAHFSAMRWSPTDGPRAWNFYDEFAPTIEDLIVRFESALLLHPDVKSHYDLG